jgi:hypothetical protein
MSIDIEKITRGLIRGADGIWYSASDSKISYPEKASQDCFSVEDNSFWFSHRNNCILNALDLFPDMLTVFDIGGGNGFQGMAMQAKGLEVILIEPGKFGAKMAQNRGLTHVICSSLQDAGFAQNSMMAASLFDVLEHIEDDEKFITDLHTLLQPSGKLILTVPAFMALWSNVDQIAGHHRRYTLKTLENLLTSAGFKVVYKTYIFSLMVFPLLFLRALPSRLGLLKLKSRPQDLQRNSFFITKILNMELGYLTKGKSLPIGTSCLVVAESIS